MGRSLRGPRRAASMRSYVRATRVVAAVALLALVGGIVSDSVSGPFWGRHALLAGVVSSALVVMLSVALVNEALERRSRRRWSVLAQYVMFDLVRYARLTWTGVMELAGAISADAPPPEWLAAGGRTVRDTPSLTEAVRRLLADHELRPTLHEAISRLADEGNALIGRWAAVMLNVEMYAEIVDRHVELASQVVWLASLLDAYEPTDASRRRGARCFPAVQLERMSDDGWLADRLAGITQLAELLDRVTMQVALRVVPVEWWEARLGATVPPELRATLARS